MALAASVTKKFALAFDAEDEQNEVKVGLIADLHFGNLAPDGIERFKVSWIQIASAQVKSAEAWPCGRASLNY